MTESTNPGRWQPGESGNPKGKKPGSGELQRLRASIASDVPDILAGLVTAAKGGDTQAAKLILERIFPAVKPIEQAQTLDLPEGTLTDQGRAILASVASGEIAPGQGAVLIGALGTLARVSETDELAARVAQLERNHAKT